MNGFSLIELLVVLVILAGLLTIAFPGYEQVVRKSARAAARVALLDVVTRQQQFFIYHKRYATDLADLGLPSEYFIDARGDAVAQPAASFEIRLQIEQTGYSGAEALAVNRQSRDAGCLRLVLSQIGRRYASAVDGRRALDC